MKHAVMIPGLKVKNRFMQQIGWNIYWFTTNATAEITGSEGKGLKILTPSKLLTRLSVLLAQIKAGKNSYKLNNEIM